MKGYKDYVFNKYIISMSSDNSATTSTADRFTGRVKWFNNKAGYGFITVTDGARSGTDIFVHHSSLGVSGEQYKYLVQGEYVEFEIVAVQGGAHEIQAGNVSGIKAGKLMCETRREFKIARSTHQPSNDARRQDRTPVTERRPARPSNPRTPNTTRPSGGRGPTDNPEWTMAKRSTRPPRRNNDVPK